MTDKLPLEFHVLFQIGLTSKLLYYMIFTVAIAVVCRSVPNVESYNIKVSRSALYVGYILGWAHGAHATDNEISK